MKKRRRFTHPLDLKTGTVLFTPVLQATGKRLKMRVDYRTFPVSNAPGYHGTVQDLKTGRRYAVYGKECGIHGCNCDAWAVEVTDES